MPDWALAMLQRSVALAPTLTMKTVGDTQRSLDAEYSVNFRREDCQMSENSASTRSSASDRSKDRALSKGSFSGRSKESSSDRERSKERSGSGCTSESEEPGEAEVT